MAPKSQIMFILLKKKKVTLMKFHRNWCMCLYVIIEVRCRLSL